MTRRTPEEARNCVESTVFAEVEETHYWTLQPPLAAYLDIHRSISVCSWCGSQSQRGVCRKLPAARLPDLHRWDARLLAVQLRRGDGNLQLHGLHPRLQELRTPGREWRSLRQVRRPVMSGVLDPGIARLESQRLDGRRKFRFPGAATSRVETTIPRGSECQPGIRQGDSDLSQPQMARCVNVPSQLQCFT